MTKQLRDLPTGFCVTLMLTILLSGLLVGCDLLSVPQTPEQRILELLQKTPDVKTAQILGSRSWSDGTVVLYTVIVNSPGPSLPMEMFGAYVHTNGTSSEDGGAASNTGKMTSRSLLCYGVELGGNYAIVYGKVKLPDVAEVEADFTNGETRRDKTSDGVYAIIEPANSTPQTIRALSATGQVLYQVSINRDENYPTQLQCGP